MRRSQLVLLALAVAAVSTAGPLIREADAPALAVAAWRNLLAAGALGVFVAARRRPEPLDAPTRRQVVLAGVLLAGHFATWVPSVQMTTVSSSVALVCTTPVWTALLARLRGELVTRREWIGIAVAIAGVLVLSGVDLSVSRRALAGDALALAGGILAAGYLVVGAGIRRTVSTTVYTFGCYGVAGVLLAAATGAAGDRLAGFDGRTWLVLLAMAAGPQLLGHSLFNRVLPEVGTTVVSVAILLEVLGASLLAWWWSGETPPVAAIPAAAFLLGGVTLVATANSGARTSAASPGSPATLATPPRRPPSRSGSA